MAEAMSTIVQIAARRQRDAAGRFASGEIPFAERYEESIIRLDGENACWIWKDSKQSKGYGTTIYEGRQMPASRAVYLEFVGPLSKDEQACHSCDNPPCCRPSHLFKGTALDNRLDSIAKGRYPHGESSATHKLSVAQVREIRQCAVAGLSKSAIARHLHLPRKTVSNVVLGRTWCRDK